MVGNVATAGQGKPDPRSESKCIRLWVGGGGREGGRELMHVEVLSCRTYTTVYLVWTDCGVHTMHDHELSGEEDWDLPFPPNHGIHDSRETSEDNSNESGGGEGPIIL
jgi:hypothetical protein